MIRVMIVAGHIEVMEGLSTVLRLSGSIQLTGLAAGREEALAQARAATPDVALVDLEMPAGEGCETIRALARAGVRVIALTAHEWPSAHAEALRAGARRVMLKGMDVGEMVAAILSTAS